MKKKIFIFGCGYVGQYVTQLLQHNQCEVIVTGSKINLSNVTFYDFRNSYTYSEIKAILPRMDVIISLIPPIKGRDIVFDFLQNHAIDLSKQQIIYGSSTGVYADSNGEWITENGAISTDHPISKARYEAEQNWQKFYQATVLRFSGIYGPERNLITRFQKVPIQIPIEHTTHFFNRIHVQDIAQIILKLIEYPMQNEFFNISDLKPAPMIEVLTYLFENLKLDKEAYIQYVHFEELSPMSQYFYRSNKRISSQKIIEKLQYQFLYPTYIEGFQT